MNSPVFLQSGYYLYGHDSRNYGVSLAKHARMTKFGDWCADWPFHWPWTGKKAREKIRDLQASDKVTRNAFYSRFDRLITVRSSLKEIPKSASMKSIIGNLHQTGASVYFRKAHSSPLRVLRWFRVCKWKAGEWLSGVVQRKPWRTIFYLRRATTELRRVR